MTSEAPIELAELARRRVDELSGVGPKKAIALGSVGVETVLDLLTYYPRRYLDRTREARIADVVVGQEVMVLAQVGRVDHRRTRNRRDLVTAQLSDGSGKLRATFFNQPWRERQLKPGTEAVFYGKVDRYRGALQMTNPVVDLIGDRTGRIVPVYPQSEKAGLSTWEVSAWVAEALRRCAKRGFAEPLPRTVLDRFDLVGRGPAFRHIHEPGSMADAHQARRRLVFDELLRVQLALILRKRLLESSTRGIRHRAGSGAAGTAGLIDAFHARLPFPLTAAQNRVIAEIEADLVQPVPMHRLLQGDVGSGKTVVAVSAMLVAVQGGHQGALMAPTEVLAEQHYEGIRQLVDGLTVESTQNLFGERDLRVEIFTSRVSGKERARLYEDLADGEIDLAVGTHALIQEEVAFRSLGVVVVDEQHRFGVEQRAALRDKGAGGVVPDVLVMTATPIPRTAAMTVYGDLDVSVLDELPPGRTPVDTVWARSTDDTVDVWRKVRSEVGAGHQAFVVCPLIEESEKLQVASAEDTYAELVDGELAGLRVGLLHGRVTPAEKEVVMGLFREGGLDVLVATTVIEVGVDVPNATVMVVLDADRFGMAQLHQLRGRVGRSGHRSACYLLGDGTNPDAEARLSALVKTADGFELAEIDLDIRGEGTIMGDRQKGRNDLKLASLRRDREWVGRAREVAIELVGRGRGLDRHAELKREIGLFLGEEDADYLLKS
ncbi:MAG: ATP-dependent DNA helicase RecG [Acidimicrobiales bacterium]|nr:MAG: ATP-dependent DNA helicase RecG [Actinomycetota bacterium]MBV6509222.1 ATP-dependent DNA helicase RecG [Acidimicrobiales bacterium]RIK08436.1 MAG: DNA helicase RecG [Acidobacteriota bacterium]